MATRKDEITVEGRPIAISNLDKVLYPGHKFTKAHVIDYYIRTAKYLLPHLKNRPVTLKRFPNGVFGEFFYEKDAPSFTPDWVKTFAVPRREQNGADIRYIVVNDLPTLVWLANLANIELHPFLHRVPKIDQPTSIVFDCDPGEGAGVLTCTRVAFMLRETLDDLGLKCFAKVSGSKGLQVYVPLNTPVTYAATQPLAKAIAELLAKKHPTLIVADMSKALRRRRVFIDWSQNSDYKTTVGVYSLRAKSYKPLVSMPVTWEELKTALDGKDASSLMFTPEAALARVGKLGDLFKPNLSLKQTLPRELNLPSTRTSPRQSISSQAQPKRESAGDVRSSRQGSRRGFLIQKRSSTYNLRLEIGAILKSWSFPIGLPGNERTKRKATAIDEAPRDLLNTKPRDAWDAGTYQLIEGSYRTGLLRVFFEGDKIKGEWRLTRLGDKKLWLIEKV